MTKAVRFAKIVDGEGATLVECFGPGAESDPVSEGLRILTHQIELLSGDEVGGVKGFGGSFGYGTDFENDVFKMHEFCWCEKEGCLWCGGNCGCDSGECEFEIDGVLVGREEYDRVSDRFTARWAKPDGGLAFDLIKKEKALWDAALDERNRRVKTIRLAVQHQCEPKGLMTDRGRSGDWRPRQDAPHFWHKPSGFKVWWYKYIGRDNELWPKEITGEEWLDVLSGCLASISALPLTECALLYRETCERDAESFKEGMEAMLAVSQKMWTNSA